MSKAFVKSGEVHDVELPLRHREGHRIDTAISVSVGALDAEGKVAESILILRDISRRKEAEAALTASEARYQDLYHNAPDMFASLDCASKQIVQCNRTLVKVTGLARNRLIGRPVFDLFAPSLKSLCATPSTRWTKLEMSGTSSFGCSVTLGPRRMSACTLRLSQTSRAARTTG